MNMDPLTTMHQAVRKHFKDERLAQLFEHFVQYVGSSPFVAPAILCLIAWVQIGAGLLVSDGRNGRNRPRPDAACATSWAWTCA